MNNIHFRESYTKKLLMDLLKMKPSKFKEWLREMEPELIIHDHTYSKHCSILTPRAFKFLLAEYGFEDREEVNKLIEEYYKKPKTTV